MLSACLCVFLHELPLLPDKAMGLILLLAINFEKMSMKTAEPGKSVS
jgi:hypothetical protein